MKKILVLLVLLLGVFGLTACDGNDVDFETDILSAFQSFEDSLNGSVVITTTMGDETLVTELKYAFVQEGETITIDELMYKQVDDEEMHVYVKEGVAYILEDGLKVKSTLSSAEEQTILADYGFANLFSEMIALYNADFFSALILDEVTEDSLAGVLATFTLDLAKYTGTEINKENVTGFTMEVQYTPEVASIDTTRIFSVVNTILRGEVESTIAFEFESLTKPVITFPTDLNTYVEAQYN